MTNNLVWFKHPRNLSNDKRVSAIITCEGAKGYGTYLYIIEVLHMQPDGKLSFNQLDTMKRKGFGKGYMKKIIRDYQLFNILGDEFESAIDYSGSKERAAPAPKSSENAPVFALNSRNTERIQNENEESKTEAKTLIIKKKQPKKSLMQIRQEKRRREKKRVEEEKRREGTATAATPFLTSPTQSPIQPWRTLVDALAENNAWLEIACIKSGFGQLLMRHLDKAIEIFKQHIEAYDKGGDLLQMPQVHAYFMNYVRAGCRTSQELRQTLQKLDAKQRPPAANPYRYEQQVDGKRTYLGCPIPHHAPPRPDANAFWDEENDRWITDSKPHAAPH